MFVSVIAAFYFFAFIVHELRDLRVIDAHTFVFDLDRSRAAYAFYFFRGDFRHRICAIGLTIYDGTRYFFNLNGRVLSVSYAYANGEEVNYLTRFIRATVRRVSDRIRCMLYDVVEGHIFREVQHYVLFRRSISEEVNGFFIDTSVSRQFLVIYCQVMGAFNEICQDFCIFRCLFRLNFRFFNISIASSGSSLRVKAMPFDVMVASVLVERIISGIGATSERAINVFEVQVRDDLYVDRST